jgi:catechol 2,3-dioxygenase-like lactoylglutathione lyase family enzyme
MNLSYVSIVSSDLDRLRDFYVEALGLAELSDWSHEGFRAIDLGSGLVLALHSPEAYAELGLTAPTSGHVAPLLTFDPGSGAELHRLHEQFVAQGIDVVREPFETSYGSLQVIHSDVDGNPFRLNTFNV